MDEATLCDKLRSCKRENFKIDTLKTFALASWRFIRSKNRKYSCTHQNPQEYETTKNTYAFGEFVHMAIKKKTRFFKRKLLRNFYKKKI